MKKELIARDVCVCACACVEYTVYYSIRPTHLLLSHAVYNRHTAHVATELFTNHSNKNNFQIISDQGETIARG